MSSPNAATSALASVNGIDVVLESSVEPIELVLSEDPKVSANVTVSGGSAASVALKSPIAQKSPCAPSCHSYNLRRTTNCKTRSADN